MSRAGIFGVGGALPEHVVANADLAAGLDTTDEWIVKRTGIRERRWLNGSQTLTGLAAEASAAALADAHRRPEDVDHVLAATFTADHLIPALASELAGRLGIEAPGADVNAACAGFLHALDQAAALVDSGRADVVLVCGADACSKVTDPHDRSTRILFGDGAGAVVVARGELELGCPPLVLGGDGDHAELLYADAAERLMRMQGREVYRHAVDRMAAATATALRRAGLTAGELDLLVAHQANARILDAVAAELGLEPHQVARNVDLVANTSSASIPLALWEADRDGRLRPGARVALAAFGAGFAWGAGVVSWKERALVCI